VVSSGGASAGYERRDQECATRLQLRLADLAPAVLSAPPGLGRTRLVCVDGPACAGKSTLAERLVGVLGGCPVIHMDDLYEGWQGLPTVGDRLRSWVLDPMLAGCTGRFRRYDWTAGAYAEWHDVPAAPALVVEGVGSAGRQVDGVATLVIWVEADSATRFARGQVRDGGAFGPYWDAWADAERRHFAAEDTRTRADLVVDGGSFGHDLETQIVVTRAAASLVARSS
jgi:hypothetical protein